MTRDAPSLTSLPASPLEERNVRIGQYLVAMLLRLVCLGLCFVTPGWWILLPAIGVIVLPLIAVGTANVVNAKRSSTLRRSESHVPSLTSFTP